MVSLQNVREFVQDWFNAFEIPNPAALPIRSALAEIFRNKSHHLKEKIALAVGVIIDGINLTSSVAIAGVIAQSIRYKLQGVEKITAAHVLHEPEAITRLRLALIAEPPLPS